MTIKIRTVRKDRVRAEIIRKRRRKRATLKGWATRREKCNRHETTELGKGE